MNIFSKAAQGLNLTPAQRAFLKLLKLWFYTALSAGVMAGAQYLLNNQQVNWQALIYITGGAFLLSLFGALDKYWTAQGDLPLSLLTEAGIQRVQQLQERAPVAQLQQAQSLPAQQAPEPIVLQPRQQSVPQVPFPPATQTVSFGFPPATQTVSFGDSQIIPVIKQ